MPQTLEPDDPITLAEEHFRQQLAACAMAQEFLQVNSADAALYRIFRDGVDPPGKPFAEYTLKELAELRPFVMVYTAEKQGFSWSRAAYSGVFLESGTLACYLVREIPADCVNNVERAVHDLKRQVGRWMAQAAALSQQAGYLDVTRITLMEVAQGDYDLESGQGKFVDATLRIDWGVR